MNFLMHFLVFFLIFSAQVHSSLASSEALRAIHHIKIKKNKIDIHLTDDDWHHITHGKETARGFSGGHDFKPYFKNHILPDSSATIYFDGNMNAYVVSSTKGDSLPEILIKLQQRNAAPRYHTLFPPNVLTRDFTYQAFEKALREKTIDTKKGLFYTEFEGLRVAGRFTSRKRNVYAIKTIHPDLSWFYRGEFGSPSATFAISRFYEYERASKTWVSQGGDLNELVDEQYHPSPRTILGADLISSSPIQMDGEDFSVMHKVKDRITTNMVNGIREKFSVLDFFFDNPDNPGEDEFERMMIFLADLIPTFNVRFKKTDNLKRRVSLTKIALMKRDIVGHILECDDDDAGRFVLMSRNLKNAASALHFGEELLHQMLLVNSLKNTFSEMEQNPFRTDQRLALWTETACAYAKRFSSWLLGDPDYEAMLENSDFLLAMRTLGDSDYAITLNGRADFRLEALRTKQCSLIAAACVRGERKLPCTLTITQLLR